MVNFPTSFDNNVTLFLAVNNKRTQLTSDIDASTLTIPVVTTSGFPTSGYITILSTADITQAEAISYSSVGPNQFNATQRGAGNTPVNEHFLNDNVDHAVVADHHNSLKDAIINLEHFVGISGSENFLPWLGNRTFVSPGNGIFGTVSSTGSTVSGTLTAQSGVFSQSLTISGVPVPLTGGSSLTVRETDGSPLVNNVTTIVVTTGTLTDNGGGQVTILTGGGGGGGGGGSVDELQVVLLSQVFG